MESLSRTTVTLPAELLRAANEMVRQGRVRSRNELLAIALLHELELLEPARIDAEFQGMASDGEYEHGVRQILAEFAEADREAIEAGEPQAHDTGKAVSAAARQP